MIADDLVPLIKDRCRALNLTEGDLSHAVAGHGTVVADIRRGKTPSAERLKKICDVLGLEFYIGPSRDGSTTNQHSASRPESDNLNKWTLREEVAAAVDAKTEALRAEIANMVARLDAISLPDDGTNRRIREPELIIPTLMFLSTKPNGIAQTSDIIKFLEERFRPVGDDAETLTGRKDSRFSQIVRNMISHRKDTGSFIRNGYADYLSDLQGLGITDKGRKLLKELVNE